MTRVVDLLLPSSNVRPHCLSNFSPRYLETEKCVEMYLINFEIGIELTYCSVPCANARAIEILIDRISIGDVFLKKFEDR